VEDRQEDGLTTSWTGAYMYVRCRRLYDWRTTDNSRGESLASMDHVGLEF